LSSENIITAIEDYDIFSADQEEPQDDEGSEIDIPSTHHFKELLDMKINYGPTVFNFVRPDNHRFYITEAAKTYHQVAPFKLKHIALSITDGPVINRPNYF
jgi:hypothetical protein